jgi:processing peptidase subunit alpha
MFEAADTRGAAHMLETLAFGGTEERSGEAVSSECQLHGMTASGGATRDALMYKVDTIRESTERAVALVAETSLHGALTERDMAAASRTMAYQWADHKDVAAQYMQDLMHAAAYGDGTPLGTPVMCDTPKFSRDSLLQYRSSRFTPENMVLAGAGVDHDELVGWADKYFGHVQSPEGGEGAVPAVSTTYKGGWAEDRYAAGSVQSDHVLNAHPPLVHFAVCFPTVGWSDKDVVTVCVLDTLLGGGSAFSAGGPGKGMYSRLYTQVLNRYAWAESINAFSAQYAHVGLFGIYGSGYPQFVGDMATTILNQLLAPALQPIQADELSRARNQLASSVLMNLEFRGILAEDIGRQILMLGRRFDPAPLCDMIQSVTATDIQRVARTGLMADLAVAMHAPTGAAVPEQHAILEAQHKIHDMLK